MQHVTKTFLNFNKILYNHDQKRKLPIKMIMHNSMHISKHRNNPLHSCLSLCWMGSLENTISLFPILSTSIKVSSLLLILIGLSLDINAPCQGGDMTLLLSSAGSRHLRLMWGLNMGSRDSIHLLTSPWRQCPVLSILALIFDTSSITEDEEESSRKPG